MGWQDRDWAKFDEAEWNDLLGGGTTTLPPPHLSAERTRRRPLIGAVLTVVTLVSFAGTVGVDAFHRLGTHGPSVSATAPPLNVVAIHWRDSDVSPAPSSGRICVSDTRLGEVCADYVAGEKPADVLTRRIESLGGSVRSG